jgi:hypothetical protein
LRPPGCGGRPDPAPPTATPPPHPWARRPGNPPAHGGSSRRLASPYPSSNHSMLLANKYSEYSSTVPLLNSP